MDCAMHHCRVPAQGWGTEGVAEGGGDSDDNGRSHLNLITGTSMQRRNFIKRLALTAALATVGLTAAVTAQAADTIKVGVLHSLSGTMAISETVLKDVALMTIDEINAKGGLLGKKLEPVVVDPASNWPLFAEKARQLISRTRSPSCSAAGPRYRASRCCRCSRN